MEKNASLKNSYSFFFHPHFTRASSSNKWVGLTNDQDFWKKNDELKRPLSSHITIYRWPLPAVLSVFHRGTGAAMTLTISAAALQVAFGGEPFQYYVDFIKV